MVVQYTIDRKSLYKGEYENAEIKIVSGGFKDKITLTTHLSVIYHMAKVLRRKREKAIEQK